MDNTYSWLTADTIYGWKIYADTNLVETYEVVIPRTWRERLLSWPWTPWKRTRVIIRERPKMVAYQVGNNLYMHPDLIERIIRKVPSRDA